MVAAGVGAGMGFREIGGVAVYMKMHVAGMILEYGVRMRRTVLQEVENGLRIPLVHEDWVEARVPKATNMVESTAQA